MDIAPTSLMTIAHRARTERLKRMARNAVPDRGINLRRKTEPAPAPPPPPEKPIPKPAPLPIIISLVTETVPITGHFDVPFVLPWQINIGFGHMPRRGKSRIKMERIQAVVCFHYNILRSEMLSQARFAKLVRPRHVAYYITKALTGRSLAEIARCFGDRHHTSVMHGIQKIGRRRLTDPNLDYDIKTIMYEITSP